MSDYNLNHLLSNFVRINPQRANVDRSKIDSWIKLYTEAANPDFLIVFDMSNFSDPILFQKNYKLKLPTCNEEDYLSTIISSVEKENAAKVFRADERIIRFAQECYSRVRRISYRLKFKAEFIPGELRSIVRDIAILSRDEDSKPNLILVAFFDITELHGIKSNLQIDIKKYDDDSPDKDFEELKRDLKEIITPSVRITKREKQILQLISDGKTSEEIAEQLIISTATVNTHRQNLIKKHNVKNTSALLKTL